MLFKVVVDTISFKFAFYLIVFVFFNIKIPTQCINKMLVCDVILIYYIIILVSASKIQYRSPVLPLQFFFVFF